LVAALKGDDFEDSENISMNIADCTGESEYEHKGFRGKQKQFDPYKVDKLSRIPTWIKALFIKWWFAGAVCYFVVMGINLGNSLDATVLCGAVLGLIVDVLVNPLFRYMESDRKEYNAYMMFPFPFKQFWTFFTNILYYIVVLICVMYCFTGINELINFIQGTTHKLHVGVEPLLFAVFAVAVDMAFIGIKDGIVHFVKKRKSKKKESAVNV
ncbi:MAG: hypothetical protein K2N33_00600, partial [Clostridia bacterium]|nr:hypothetical protein [Clostridia bacterium]